MNSDCVAVGEVDVFKVEPDHELYAHMNVNYLRTDKVPKFSEGWQSTLDVLRAGQFFVTSGEVLIPEFSANGKQSGQVATIPDGGKLDFRIQLEWTFPLSHAEIISGDGQRVKRHKIDLRQTAAHGNDTLELSLDMTGQSWARLEVWDIATNGAFTQPIWLQAN